MGRAKDGAPHSGALGQKNMSNKHLVIATFITFIISFGMSIETYNKWSLALSSGEYTKKVFIITSFKHEKIGKESPTKFWYCTGTVDGKSELMSFYRTNIAYENVRKKYRVGDKVCIMYNPTKPYGISQGLSLRALHCSFSLKHSFIKAILFSCISILPLLICLLILGCRYIKTLSKRDVNGRIDPKM